MNNVVIDNNNVTATSQPPWTSTTLTDDITQYWQYQTCLILLKYCPPILLIVGNAGNLLSVITLQSSLFRSSSTSFILTTLALLDSAVLDTSLLRFCIQSFWNIDIRNFGDFSCKFHMMLTYYVHQLASWTLILLTSERIVSVFIPLRCKELCAKRRIVAVWCAIAAVLFLVNSHIFFTVALNHETTAQEDSGSVATVTTSSNDIVYDWNSTTDSTVLINFTNIVGGTNASSRSMPELNSTASSITTGSTTVTNQVLSQYCSPHNWANVFFSGPWNLIDSFLGDIIPFVVVFFGNVAIVVRITRARRQRADRMRVVAKKDGKVSSTTIMLIVVGIIFLILSLPMDIYFIGYSKYGSLPTAPTVNVAKAVLFYAAAYNLYCGNSAINFFLYFLSGQKFRHAFRVTFCCGWGGGGSGASGSKSGKSGVAATTSGVSRVRDTMNASDMSMTEIVPA